MLGRSQANDGSQPQQSQQQASQLSSQQINMQAMMRSVRLAKCKDHGEESYTNFCCNSQCMKALCPDCIDKHTQYHKQSGTYPDIQSIRSVRVQCKNKLSGLKNSLEQLCDQIDDFAQQSGHLEEQDEGYKKIQRCKELMIDIMTNYFDSLSEKYKQRVQNLTEKEEKTKSVQEKLSNYLEEVESLSSKLDSQVSQIDALNDVQTLDWSVDLTDLEKQIQDIQSAHQKYSIDVIVEENKIRLFKSNLLQYIRLGSCILPDEDQNNDNQIGNQANEKLKNLSLLQMQKEQPMNQGDPRRGEQQIEDHSNKQISKQQIKSDQNIIMQLTGKLPNPKYRESQNHSNIQIPKLVLKQELPNTKQNNRFHKDDEEDEDNQSFPSHQTTSRFNKEDEEEQKSNQMLVHFEGLEEEIIHQSIPLQVGGYFENSCPYKYLPYFSNSSKTLFLIDVNNTTIVKHYQVEEAFGEFHKILVTPRGDIFLIGGIIKGQETNRVYKFDFTENKFTERHSMSQPRSSLAAVFGDKGSIFVIGGKKEGFPTADCERYDVLQNKWKQMANLNNGVYAASACTFNDTYIFKFGGIGPGQQQNNNMIERYNISNNIWEVIKPKIQDLSGLRDIDSKFILFFQSGCLQINENQIYVFGGQFKKTLTKSNFFLDVKQTQINGKNQDIFILNSFDYISTPFEGTFWQNPIIHNDKILSLQNIDGGQNFSSKSSQKRLLIFDGSKWTSDVKQFA